MARPVETSLPGTPSPPMQSDAHSFCKWVMNLVRFGQYMVVPRGKKVQKILFACIYCSPSAEQIFEPMTDCLLRSLISSLICVPRDYLRKQTPIHCLSICALCLTHADLKQTQIQKMQATALSKFRECPDVWLKLRMVFAMWKVWAPGPPMTSAWAQVPGVNMSTSNKFSSILWWSKRQVIPMRKKNPPMSALQIPIWNNVPCGAWISQGTLMLGRRKWREKRW